jgi:hypothetical protein
MYIWMLRLASRKGDVEGWLFGQDLPFVLNYSNEKTRYKLYRWYKESQPKNN